MAQLSEVAVDSVGIDGQHMPSRVEQAKRKRGFGADPSAFEKFSSKEEMSSAPQGPTFIPPSGSSRHAKGQRGPRDVPEAHDGRDHYHGAHRQRHDAMRPVESLQHMTYLLEALSKEDEKKRLKRAANRKSAYTSRARKKQYVEDMSLANRDLKQHAHILDLLPDLIIGIDRHGDISYISKSVSRKLQYSAEALYGASIFDLVTSQTRHVVTTVLQREILDGPHRRASSRHEGSDHSGAGSSDDDGSGDGGGSAGEGSGDGSGEGSAGDGSAGDGSAGDGSGDGSRSSEPFRPNHRRGEAESTAALEMRPPSELQPSESASRGSVSASASVQSVESLSLASTSQAATTSASGTSNQSTSNSSDCDETESQEGGSGDELGGRRPAGGAEAADPGGPSDGRFAAWSHLNLQRHNEEIDQQNEQAFWNICLIRRDRTTLWCEANSNLRQHINEVSGPDRVAVELIFSMRPVREGPAVPTSVSILADLKPVRGPAGAPCLFAGASEGVPPSRQPDRQADFASVGVAPPGQMPSQAKALDRPRGKRATEAIPNVLPGSSGGQHANEVVSEHVSELAVAKTLLGLMGM